MRRGEGRVGPKLKLGLQNYFPGVGAGADVSVVSLKVKKYMQTQVYLATQNVNNKD